MVLSKETIAVGTDMETIARFKDISSIQDHCFFERVYLPSELSYCFAQEDPSPFLALCFTAKESVVKALSSCTDEVIDYQKIEILFDNRLRPEVRLHQPFVSNLTIQLNVSYTEKYAMAFVLILREDCRGQVA